MLIGFSKYYGVGGSGPVLGYLTGYLVNGEARSIRPEVVRGDPDAVASIIDNLQFNRRYTSGVLSFHPDDRVTPETQKDIMDRFENVAFAGLPTDRRCIVWIRHQDKGREELHFVAPRVDLGTGKSLNIAPPTPASRQLFDTLQSAINLRYGFQDPSDPARAQDVSLPDHVAKLAAQALRLGRSPKPDIRQDITEKLLEQARNGLVKNRSDVVLFLVERGFAVSRASVNSITIIRPDTREHIRLKGEIYRKYFCPEDLNRAPARQDPARLLTLDRRLDQLVEKRATYNRARYGVEEPSAKPSRLKEEIVHDRTRNTIVATRPAHGAGTPGTRTAVCGAAVRLDDAAQRFSQAHRNLDRAGQRFGHADRTLAIDFDQKLAACQERQDASLVFSNHGISMSAVPRPAQRGQGFEPELEMEFGHR